jgi:hypothetical protein
MAARTTAAEVKDIIDTDLTDPVIDSYIAGASALVTQVLGTETSLSDEIKEEIERWLTAHMIATTKERVAKREGAGGANIEYAGEFGKGLESTSYGQMVLTLDTSGKMSALASRAASIFAVEGV